ncbi:MAG: hypothetical protein JW936_03770 [Sedimentisphaerales bacterium]|nr:hypothetical protein [Sedimentisphaerales bacterium]
MRSVKDTYNHNIRCAILLAAAIYTALATAVSAQPAPLNAGNDRLTIDFPIGWLDSMTPEHVPDIAAAGFNCVIPYGYRLDYLDVAAEHNVGVIQYLCGWGGEGLTDFVNEYKNSPALIAWEIRDEPIGGHVMSIDVFTDCVNTVRAADPSRDVTAIFCVTDSRMLPYLELLDFAMVDRYPVLASQSSPSPSLYNVARDVKYVVEQSDRLGLDPPIYVAQAHAFPATNPLREPTAFESRYMTFAPVTVGARGIFYFAWFETSEGHRAEVAVNAAQLSSVVPAITSGESLTGVTIVSNRDSDTADHNVNDITYLLAKLTEDETPCYYLIATNNSGSAQDDVTFTISALPTGTYTAEVLYESRSVTLTGAESMTLVDDFADYEVHIYKITAR